MSVTYSQTCINARLNGVVSTIGNGGFLKLLAGGTIVSTITLASPCGTVNGGILTFTGSLVDPSAAATGSITSGQITDSGGTVVVSGLTVGIPGNPVDITISNGLNSTLVTAGQTVQLLGAQITGS